MNDFETRTANEQRPHDGDASKGEKRTASGTASGEWLVNIEGDVVVPMTTAEIVEAVRAARLAERSLVWRIGMHDWTVLVDVPQLRLATSTSTPPASSVRVATHAPAVAQAEGQRRRNTLPFGFPAVKDPASVRQPAGLSTLHPPPKPARASATPLSAPMPSAPSTRSSALMREEESDALAVYERPAASLTFSDSVRAEWHGTSRLVNHAAPTPPSAPNKPASPLRTLTPMPVAAARLAEARSSFPHSLAPITAEAENSADSRAPRMWGDLSVVLASELREAKKSSKRVALWAALASAAVASAVTLWIAHAHAPVLSAAAERAPLSAAPAAQPIAAPVIEAIAAPAASSVPVASSTSKALAKAPALQRAAMRPRARPKPVAKVVEAPSEGPASAEPGATAPAEAAAPALTATSSPSPVTAPNVETEAPSAPAVSAAPSVP